MTKLMPIFIFFILVLTGCSRIGNTRISTYDLNCSECNFKLRYDTDDSHNKLDLKGL